MNNKLSHKFRLSVHLLFPDPVWISLLKSEGVFFNQSYKSEEFGKHAVCIMPASSSIVSKVRCRDFVINGGVAIYEKGGIGVDETDNIKIWYMPYDKNWFYGIGNINDPKALQIKKFYIGDGIIFQLPFKLNNLWNNYSVARRFINIGMGRYIYEEMAAIIKKNVRRVIIDILKSSFFIQGLPYVHRWYYPGLNRTVFCFRGDADGGKRDNTIRWINTVRPYAECSSIFFCTSQYEQKLDLIKKSASYGFEIGSHNHWHIVFLDTLTNKLSIELAEKTLLKCFCRPIGFVAPAYFYNPKLSLILKNRNYSYSSCFGVNHDSMPFFPVVNDRIVDLVEIPFHCLGDRFPRFNISMKSEIPERFFKNLIRKKYASCEPILLYSHPDLIGRMGENPKLIRSIFKTVLEHSDVKCFQLREFASWWRKREKSHLDCWYDTQLNRFSCEVKKKTTNNLMIHVEFKRNGHYMFKIPDRLSKNFSQDQMIQFGDICPPKSNEIGEVVEHKGSRSLRFLTKRNIRRFLLSYSKVYAKPFGFRVLK